VPSQRDSVRVRTLPRNLRPGLMNSAPVL